MSRTKLIISAAATDAGTPVAASGIAYTGGLMSVSGYDEPIALELSGMEIPAQLPLLANHENETGKRVGMTSATVKDQQLGVSVQLFPTNALAADIIAQGRAGADWQLSIGADPLECEFVPEGQSRVVNGQTLAGPFYHITRSTLHEVSVVPVGADNQTSLSIAASAVLNNSKIKGAKKMDEKLKLFIAARYNLGDGISEPGILAHLQSIGRTIEDEKADQEKTEAEAPPQNEDDEEGKEEKPVEGADPECDEDDDDEKVKAKVKAAMSSERKRESQIRAAFNGEHPDLMNRCINEGISVHAAKARLLDTIRANRPTAGAFAIGGATPGRTGAVIEAALMLNGGIDVDSVAKNYAAPVVEAAQKQFRHGLGLQELIVLDARQYGFNDHRIHAGNWSEALRCISRGRINAAFSDVNLANIFSNTANKFLLEGYGVIDDTWREISKIVSVKDFKPVSLMRLGGDLTFKKVPETGEIKSGKLSDSKIDISADTSGVLISLTRQDIINDDLGALTGLSTNIGLAAGQSFNAEFWKVFLDNSNFFTSAKKNLVSGNPLSIANLGNVVKVFRALKDEFGNRIGMRPELLLVPPSLEATAENIFASTNIFATGVGSSKAVEGSTNIYANKFRPLVGNDLDNSDFTGNSSTAYYLLGNPRFRAPMAVAFLNGKQTPTIESSDMDFSTLGIQMRAYMDTGFELCDPGCGVKVAGA